MFGGIPQLLVTFALLAAWPARAELQEAVGISSRTAISNCHNISSGLSADEKDELLRAHNVLRSQVAMGQLSGLKPAANMLALSWDEELAELAGAHARRCGAATDEQNGRKALTFATVGLNVGWEASSEPFTDHLDLPHLKVWANEHKDVDGDVISSFHDTESGIGQFTQMIWANTQSVGCGVATYTRKDNVGRYPYQRSLTCYYGPGGNVAGESVYEEGSSCSRCPPGSTCDKRSGLCHIDYAKVPKVHQAKEAKDEWNWRPFALAIMLVIWLCI